MRGDETDAELVTRYRDGDVAALEGLVRRHERLLGGYIANMLQRRGDVDEIFQEVWFRVIRKLHRYRDDNFKGWLLRIAHNIVIDQVRRRKPDVSLDEETGDGGSLLETLADSGSLPDGTLADRELGHRIARAVEQLPVEQRETFLMRVQGQLAFKDIARIQKVSINTALARMQYALAKLRPLLRDTYDELAPAGR